MVILSTYFLAYAVSFILIVCTAIYLFFKNAYSYWSRRGVLSVPTKSIFGSIYDSVTMKRTNGEEMTNWYTKYKAEGQKYIGAYFFHKPQLVVFDTELIKNVMAKDFNHFVDRGGYVNEEDDPLTAHLFSLSGLKWKHLRQKLTPTFTSGKLKMMFQTLVDCTEDLKDCLDESVTKSEPIDVKTVLMQYTINVIGSCAFGIDCNSFKEPDSEFIQVGKLAFNPDIIGRIRIFFAVLFPSAAKFFKIRFMNKLADTFFRKLVKDTVEYRENNNVTRNDFMQLLIQLKNKGVLDDEVEQNPELIGTTLTMNEVAAQAFLFFFAGFETTSTTMTFALHELAENIHAQERVREEIVRVLKNHDGKITYEAIKEMQFLDRVVLETLRKHPPLMVLQRIVTEEYKMPDSELILEKNLGVLVPVYSLHYDPEFFPEPQKFEPDRFTEENKATRPDFAYLPFGDGPRVCIGVRFAMMQAKVGLCRLLCNYKFNPSIKTLQPIKLDPKTFFLSVKGGIWLNAEKIATGF